MNYFYNLPEDLQELIYKEEHKLKLNDIWNEIEERGWYFPFNKSKEYYLHKDTDGSLFLTLNEIPQKLMSEKTYADYYNMWIEYECLYGECIYDLPKNKDKDYEKELEEMYERNYDYDYQYEVEEDKPTNLVYDEREDESEF